jgi:hypothetical protein
MGRRSLPLATFFSRLSGLLGHGVLMAAMGRMDARPSQGCICIGGFADVRSCWVLLAFALRLSVWGRVVHAHFRLAVEFCAYSGWYAGVVSDGLRMRILGILGACCLLFEFRSFVPVLDGKH